jgi:predicted O-linked N-acetylglucosamine transferase (SPINDLY family)
VLRQVNIALDSFPYNGQTTTCECLSMGVPVVTITGTFHAARVGYSLLDRAGVPFLAVANAAEYVDTAVQLAADRERLSRLHAELPAQVKRSRIMDPANVAGIELLYRSMWKRWCMSPGK